MPNSTAKLRRQGLLRLEAIIPLAVVAGLAVLYGLLFLDGHLRRALEFAATRANGAEVNIGALDTRFRDASIVIRDIQVTDAGAPDRNLLHIGAIRFSMLWDALLRAKVVVEHAEVTQVGVNTPRAAPGRVLPPSEGSGTGDRVVAAFKEQLADNVIGDLVALAEGADPREQLASIGDTLASQARLGELQAELARRESAWRQRIDALPTPATVQALQTRLRAVKLDGFKDLQDVQVSLRELDAIRKELEQHHGSVRSAGSALGEDVAAYRTAYADLERVVRRDVAELQARFSLPALDTRSLAGALFGHDLMQKVASTRGYVDQARTYMPPARSQEEKAAMRPTPHPRASGTDYVFGRPNAYPRFWLKRAVISSHPDSAGLAGEVAGELSDLSTEPALLGRPTVARLSGDFPTHGVRTANAELLIDRSGVEPRERLLMTVGQYPVSGRPLVSSDALSLGFERAAAALRLQVELRGEQVDLALQNDFTDVGYHVAARSPLVQQIVQGAIADVERVNLTAKVSGTWHDLDWQLASNLGTALEKGFRRQLQAGVEQARARVETLVHERIAAERRALETQLASAEGQLKAQVAARQGELDTLRAELDKQKTTLENRQRAFVKTQEQKLKNEAGKLLDGLKLNR